MQTRREFIGQSTLAAAGLLLGNDLPLKKDTIGLQLYTVRKELSKDPVATLSRVRDTGFNSVELFGYDDGSFFGRSPREFAGILKNAGLQSPSGHYMMSSFLANGDRAIMKQSVADGALMGHEFIVIPYLPKELRTGIDDYKRLAQRLNIAGDEARSAGMQLLYHHHNFEFQDWKGEGTGFDIICKETDPSLLGLEIDFYWVTRAGLDPLKLINANAGRIRAWHVKDMSQKLPPSYTNEGEQYFTEVGTGIIDYKTIFKQKRRSGMKYFFVEQDETTIPVFESIAKSLAGVKKAKH